MRRICASCTVLAALHAATLCAQDGLPPLIPREVLFGNPDKASPRISPDGKRLAYLAPDNGVLNVWLRTVGLSDDHAVTADRDRGVRWFRWAPNNRQILYIQDKNGDENWHLYAVDLQTNASRDLTPFEGVQARVVAVEPKFPDEILVGINQRNPQLHDVYRVDLTSGEATLEVENKDGFLDWQVDANLQVRAAAKLTAPGGFEVLVRDDSDSIWRTLMTVAPEDTLNSGPVGFTPDRKGLYMANSTGSNTTELRVVDLATGKEKTLASDGYADVASLFTNPVTHAIQAVGFYKERMHWKVLDKAIKPDFKAIERVRRGDFWIVNRDHADQTWLIAFTPDDGPVSFYAYDREARKANALFTSREALECATLARMAPIGFRARDGLAIRGYLTAPPGLRVKKLPTVVLVHGGPWKRDTWGYNGKAQWLANRGYAVLQINYRGSTGYGKKFVNAANRDWGGKMHDDLIDGVNWAIAKGISDPKRVAIFGSSFGGYATLVGLSRSPDVFCCGVDIAGASNLLTFVTNLPDYYKPFEPLIWDRVGHPERDAELLKSRSPLFMVDRITKPLLIGQGANDPHVTKSETIQLVEALRKAGKEVDYVEYPNEGHGFARPENRLDFFAKAEKFLAKHLGGRYEE